MSRIRSVHPGLFTDEDFVGLSDAAQIFFVGLWTEADDYGAFEWKPVTLKIKLRGASTMPVEPLLEELRTADRIRQYEIGGRKYGVIRNFTRFQRPKFPKAAHVIPAELRKFAGSTEPITVIEGVDEPPIPRNAEKSPQMEDGGCRREEEDEGVGRKQEPPKAPRSRGGDVVGFEEWWEVYPHKVGKGGAKTKFAIALRKATLAELIAGVQRYVSSKPPDRPWANPETWLHQERWTDEPAELPAVPSNGKSQQGLAHGLASTPDEQWRRRLKDYKHSKFWIPSWGFPPNDPDCYVPISLLREFGFVENAIS